MTAGGLLAAALAACGSSAANSPSTGQAAVSQPTGTAGFAGYKWMVVTIEHNGVTTRIPAKYSVFAQFSPNGQFGANGPVNFLSGRYQVTPGGFTTSALAVTGGGYVGAGPVIELMRGAIGAFKDGTRALAQVRGNTLTIIVSGYTLSSRRDGTPETGLDGAPVRRSPVAGLTTGS